MRAKLRRSPRSRVASAGRRCPHADSAPAPGHVDPVPKALSRLPLACPGGGWPRFRSYSPMTQDLKNAFRSLVRDSLFAAVVDSIVALGRE